MDVEIVGRILSTLPEDDDHPYRTGAWRPQPREWRRRRPRRRRGEIPDDLDGVYLRNTENPVHPSIELYHPFDGDGMLHTSSASATGRPSTATGSCAPTGFVAEQEAGQPLWAGLRRAARARRCARTAGVRAAG